MQKIWIVLFGSMLLLACKKQNSPDTSQQPTDEVLFGDTTAHFTGLKPATAEQLQRIPVLENYDTSKITVLGRIGANQRIQAVRQELPNFPEAGNQNIYSYNSCIGWALGYGAMGYSYRALLKDNALDLSANFIWNYINGGQNQGDVDLVSAMEVSRDKGNCLHSLMPDNYPYNKLPEEAQKENALDYTTSDIIRFGSINLALMKAMLQRNKPLVIAIHFYPEFEKATTTYWKKTSNGDYVWTSHSILPSGYHALVITGYDDNDDFKAFKIQNSWGKKYGKDGVIWISYDVFKDIIANTSAGPEIYMVLPRVATTKAANASITSATLNGEIYNTGFFYPTQRGFCVGEGTRPTIADKTVSENKGPGSFSLEVKDLKGGVKYCVRAFASDGSRTLYGNQEVFTTNAPTAPTITTTVPADITNSSVSVGGVITSDGGADVLDKGITYSPNSNLVPGTTVSAGTGNNTFLQTINGLTPGKTYYARAYATNKAGTSYGTTVSFTTSADPNISLSGSYSGYAIWTNYDGTGQDPKVDLNFSIAVDQNGVLSGYMTIDGHTGVAVGSVSGNSIKIGWTDHDAPFTYTGTFSTDKKTIEGSGGAGNYYAPFNANGPFKVSR